MTRADALADARRQLAAADIPVEESHVEAVLLLCHAANLSREELFLRPDVPLTGGESERFGATIARRARREPLAYITGAREFYGLTFTVTPAVLIPRPETEGVVEAVLDFLIPAALTPHPSPSEGRGEPEGDAGDATLPGSPSSEAAGTAVPKAATPSGSPLPSEGEGWGVRANAVLDLCTGSGCIAVAVAVHLPEARITATDISGDALAVARSNAERHRVADRITFLSGDLFAPLPPGARFAVIASNPPYIAPDEIERLEPEVRDFEPRVALGVHADALHFYRRIASESPAYLEENGRVVVEVGFGQSEAVCRLFLDAGFADVSALPDLAGIPRVVVATGYRKI